MNNYLIEGRTPEEILEYAEAIVGENLELRRQLDELRGRLREQRRMNRAYADYKASAVYRRQITLAACGLAVALTLLLVAVAICWGWARA